ncbi:MAG: acyltransferase, partial [Actinomycetota bacterium]|nr:acyltransferase [Actinomycetota bacterium]
MADRSTRILGIDGLRALAVLAVIAFHANLSWARGGFLGVDAFFVISGFVITRSLLDEDRRRGAIDLARFWSRRVARLLPALLLVVSVVAAYACLRPIGGLQAFREDAVAALLYVSNWHFLAKGTGYFAATADPSLLQHTWSLAVEEQFYLVWPLAVVWALRRSQPR